MTEKAGGQETPKLDARLAIYNRVVALLGDDPNIERIIPAEDFDLPPITEIDYSRFPGLLSRKGGPRRLMGACYQAVLCPYIVDKFIAASDRDDWRSNLSTDGFNAFLKNALRIQTFVGVRNSVSVLQRRGSVDSDSEWGEQFYLLTDKIMETTKDLGPYRSIMTKDEQVEFARGFKSDLAELIKHVATPPVGK